MTSATGPLVLLVATRKGLWLAHADRERRAWRIDGPHFLGHEIHHVVLDPRDGRTLLAAAKTGHLGPTVFRSLDLGRTWKEAAAPPAFRKAQEGETGHVVDHVFWLTPGHASEPGVWYAGSSPEGLFRTADGGDTWQPVAGFNEHANYEHWTRGAGRHARRTEAALDPGRSARRAASVPLHLGRRRRHLREHRRRARLAPAQRRTCAATSCPSPYPEIGQDPALRAAASARARRALPAEPLRHLPPRAPGRALGAHRRQHAARGRRHRLSGPLHPRDPNTAWVFPMDGSRGVAAHQPGRQARGVRHARRGQELGAPATPASRASRPGSPCGARGCPPTRTTRSASTSAPPVWPVVSSHGGSTRHALDVSRPGNRGVRPRPNPRAPVCRPRTAAAQGLPLKAKDPSAIFPPIEPLYPPAGAPNVLVALIDDVGLLRARARSAAPARRRPPSAWLRMGSSTFGSTRPRSARRPGRTPQPPRPPHGRHGQDHGDRDLGAGLELAAPQLVRRRSRRP